MRMAGFEVEVLAASASLPVPAPVLGSALTLAAAVVVLAPGLTAEVGKTSGPLVGTSVGAVVGVLVGSTGVLVGVLVGSTGVLVGCVVAVAVGCVVAVAVGWVVAVAVAVGWVVAVGATVGALHGPKLRDFVSSPVTGMLVLCTSTLTVFASLGTPVVVSIVNG